jgi:hypothetical protein
MRRVLAALLFLAALPAGAAEPAERGLPEATDRLRQELERAAEAMRESMGKILLSLEDVARRLPRYEAPELNENGDIIIRRKPPLGKERSGREGTI